WIVFPIFSSMVANLGERQEIPVSSLIAVLSGTVVLQASYWARMRWGSDSSGRFSAAAARMNVWHVADDQIAHHRPHRSS
ncbi:hypothetical protein JTP94_25200, partial [Rhizobium lusitanum]|nr:hypothetical protein [Rhizobium lusitanum]